MKQSPLNALAGIFDNPVINRELRGRMRGPRAYWILLGYLLILSISILLAYAAARSNFAHNAYGSQASFTAGRQFFTILFTVQAILVSLIMPALTSGAISIEREQRTLDMVRCTTLKPWAIVMGKLVSSVSFIVLLLTSSLPLVSISFLLGGVAPDEVISAYAMLVCDALLFGAAGLAWSTCVAATGGATALTYGSLIGFYILTIVPAEMVAIPYFRGGVALSALNPIGAISCASVTESYYHHSLPAWVAGLTINGLLAVLLCLIGINRMEDTPWSRAAGVRIGTLAFAATLVFFLVGAFIGKGAPSSVELIPLVAVLILCPLFATGDPASEAANGYEPGKLSLNPILAFRDATLNTGPMMSVVVAAVLALETVKLAPLPAGDPVALVVASVAVAAGISGFGGVVSLLARNRWGALIITYTALGFATVLPLLATSTGHEDVEFWACLSPMLAFTDPQQQGSPPIVLPAGLQPWMAISLIYGVIGIVGLAVCVARGAAKRTDSVDPAPVRSA